MQGPDPEPPSASSSAAEQAIGIDRTSNVELLHRQQARTAPSTMSGQSEQSEQGEAEAGVGSERYSRAGLLSGHTDPAPLRDRNDGRSRGGDMHSVRASGGGRVLGSNMSSFHQDDGLSQRSGFSIAGADGPFAPMAREHNLGLRALRALLAGNDTLRSLH